MVLSTTVLYVHVKESKSTLGHFLTMLSGIFSTRVASVNLLSQKNKTFLLFSENIWNVSTVQYVGFLSFAYGGDIINLPLNELILQMTVSSKTDILGGKEEEEGCTVTDKRRLEGLVEILI